MFKPVQFSSQYNVDVLYSSSPSGKPKEIDSARLRDRMLRNAIRPTHESGVPVMTIGFDGKQRLMVDDTRVWDAERRPDATLARDVLRYTEGHQGDIREKMLGDTGLDLKGKSPAELEDELGNPFKLAEYEIGSRGGIVPDEKTDTIKLFFTKGDGMEPVLEHAEVQTRSGKLLDLSKRSTDEREGIESDLTPDGAAPSPEKALKNPIEALRAALALPTDRITYSPFVDVTPPPVVPAASKE